MNIEEAIIGTWVDNQSDDTHRESWNFKLSGLVVKVFCDYEYNVGVELAVNETEHTYTFGITNNRLALLDNDNLSKLDVWDASLSSDGRTLILSGGVGDLDTVDGKLRTCRWFTKKEDVATEKAATEKPA